MISKIPDNLSNLIPLYIPTFPTSRFSNLSHQISPTRVARKRGKGEWVGGRGERSRLVKEDPRPLLGPPAGASLEPKSTKEIWSDSHPPILTQSERLP